MKRLPPKIIISFDIFILLSTSAYTADRTSSIGVYTYFTTLSYSNIFSILIFWGTDVGYAERIDLKFYKTLTTPVLRPFWKTPEFKPKHSAEVIVYLKIA